MRVDLEDIPDDIREATYRLAGNMRLAHCTPKGAAHLSMLLKDAEDQMTGLKNAIAGAKAALRKHK